MPLIPTTLELAIKTKLELEFKNPTIKLSLQRQLDGGPLSGAISNAKNIDNALRNINLISASLGMGSSDNPASIMASQQTIKRTTSNEWASGIADAVCEWMSKEISDIIAKVIADEVTKYIKTATITIPPGQLVSGVAGTYPVVASTTSPSSPAIIL
jgi:hypothetical protein